MELICTAPLQRLCFHSVCEGRCRYCMSPQHSWQHAECMARLLSGSSFQTSEGARFFSMNGSCIAKMQIRDPAQFFASKHSSCTPRNMSLTARGCFPPMLHRSRTWVQEAELHLGGSRPNNAKTQKTCTRWCCVIVEACAILSLVTLFRFLSCGQRVGRC